jgi:hypothetical protein
MNNYFQQMKEPDRILVDLRPVIIKLSTYQNFQYLYQKFPLADIIASILTMQMLRDDGEYIWFEIENRFEDDLDNMNLDALQIFIEAVGSEVDEHIRNLLPRNVTQENYIFEQWLDKTTLILKRDETAYYNHSVPTAKFPF